MTTVEEIQEFKKYFDEVFNRPLTPEAQVWMSKCGPEIFDLFNRRGLIDKSTFPLMVAREGNYELLRHLHQERYEFTEEVIRTGLEHPIVDGRGISKRNPYVTQDHLLLDSDPRVFGFDIGTRCSTHASKISQEETLRIEESLQLKISGPYNSGKSTLVRLIRLVFGKFSICLDPSQNHHVYDCRQIRGEYHMYSHKDVRLSIHETEDPLDGKYKFISLLYVGTFEGADITIRPRFVVDLMKRFSHWRAHPSFSIGFYNNFTNSVGKNESHI